MVPGVSPKNGKPSPVKRGHLVVSTMTFDQIDLLIAAAKERTPTVVTTYEERVEWYMRLSKFSIMQGIEALRDVLLSEPGVTLDSIVLRCQTPISSVSPRAPLLSKGFLRRVK